VRARIVVLAGLAACGGGGDPADPDAREAPGDAIEEPDAERAPDAGTPDAGGVPLAGFGAISGMCGAVTETELEQVAPVWIANELTFAVRYVDPDDRDELTPGGLEVILDGNAGGSSIYSEVFAMEYLERCELATLLKTETEITYTTKDSKRADLLVELDGVVVGVSVTRAVTFPFGNPYQLDAATELMNRKLDDIKLASTTVSAADAWDKSMLSILAYDVQHAEVAMQAWNSLDAETRDDTIAIVTVTSGDDLFIYTDD
jgi:hypothetical protein